MAKKTIRDLKEKFKKQEKEKSGNFSHGDVYPFWLMNDDEKAIVRILPDLNEENDEFFVNKYTHHLVLNGEKKTVVCPKTKGIKVPCPICELSKKYYDKEDKERGKEFYKKKTAIARVLVISDPLPPDEETGENYEGKVCTTQFGWQLMDKINQCLVNDFEDDDLYPWDVDGGKNFKIMKTKPSGSEYSKYDTMSSFTGNTSSLKKLIKSHDFDAIESVDDVELVDLTTLLPEALSYDKLEAMLSAHLTGDEYTDEDDEDKDDEDEESSSKKSKKSKKSNNSKKSSKRYDEDEDEDEDEGEGEGEGEEL